MPKPPGAHEENAHRGARLIYDGFVSFIVDFKEITRRARTHFERREWKGHQTDALERLNVYSRIVDGVLARLSELHGDHLDLIPLWVHTKQAYYSLIESDRNLELAETFYNSITRRIFSTVGVDSRIEFVSLEPEVSPRELAPEIYARYDSDGGTEALFRRVLERSGLEAGFHNLAEDAARVGRRVEALLESVYGLRGIEAVETLKSLFFRGKSAYIVGRLIVKGRIVPLVLPLVNTDEGVSVDAVLMTEDEISVLFSFTRAYFHVETPCPREQVDFLRSILPVKPFAELYIALGFHKHGKTELYRDLQRYLLESDERFDLAEGDRGMVMLVFALPDYDMVFKVIRDRFDYPKNTSAREVMQRYRMVFERDRVGRLVDAQQFEHLEFDRSRFTDALLHELTDEAARTARIVDDKIVIEHLYIERKIRPLNLYLREADEQAAEAAVIDYGRAIKELAAANIFPGDFLLKNFGVTRHDRVVFYDYDELCLITDCRFREIPPPRNPEDEMAPEPWFPVAENDVFPEEFRRFLGLGPRLREVFEGRHGDLFSTTFWLDMQRRHLAGEIPGFYPYKRRARLRTEPPA